MISNELRTTVISNPNSEIGLLAGEVGTDKAINILTDSLKDNILATVGSDVVYNNNIPRL